MLGNRLTLTLALLGVALHAPARANTKICVAEGATSVANCRGSTFNVRLDFRDDAARKQYLAHVNAKFATDASLKAYFQKLNARLDVLHERIAQEKAVGDKLDELIVSLEERQRSDALFADETASRLEEAEAESARQSALLGKLEQELKQELDNATKLTQSVTELQKDRDADRRRIAELEQRLNRMSGQVARLNARSGFQYEKDRHRLSLIFRYSLELPFEQEQGGQDLRAYGVEVGYVLPGDCVPLGDWLFSTAVSFETVQGNGSAVVTDPRGVVLGETDTWRTDAVGAGIHLLVGREFGAFAAYARGGARALLGERQESVPFGEESMDAGVSVPLALGFLVRPVLGLIARIEAGTTYWASLPSGHYIYEGPTATATLAAGDTVYNFGVSFGVGYVLSL